MAIDTDQAVERRRFYRDGFTVGNFEVTPDDFWGWLTILPVLALYTIIAIIPIGFAVYASLHTIPLMNPVWEFNGGSNYVEAFQLNRFWGSMWRGILFMIGSTVIQLAVGVWMALVINKLDRGSRILSTFVFTSYLIPTIIVSLMFLFMVDQYVGVLHLVGSERLGLWDGYLFGNTSAALIGIVLISSWKFGAFVTLFTLAQLQSIPDRFYEAAKIAGATTWEMFRDVTLPRILGAILVVIFLRAIFMFNKYDIIWQLTQGGPGYASTTMPILAFRETFEASAYGLGNAIAVIMFLFLFAGGVIYMKFLNPSQEVET
ncbi:MAG: carbohydrate ABC transporter permease [Natronomonas sp.]